MNLRMVDITHVNGDKEYYSMGEHPELQGGITAVGYAIHPCPGRMILVHPAQIRKMEIWEKED